MIRLCQLCLSGQGAYLVVFRENQMKHTSQIDFGRPKPAALMQTQSNDDGPDKWQLLDRLTEAAADFELSHRTLGVLKALLSFLPTRHIPMGAKAIVFPSNATLSHRLSGMPESTLRRHLSALVRSGIVSRHDSPNGKRFARRLGKNVALAYGFDLTPLREMCPQIEALAKEERTRLERLTLLRDEVLVLRARLIVREGQGPLTTKAALILRRKADADDLCDLRDALAAAVDDSGLTVSDTAEVSTADDQNERHIQYSDKSSDVSENDVPVKTTAINRKEQTITLGDVQENCTAIQTYFPEGLHDWRDVVRIGERLMPMLGIDANVLCHARRVMGLERASIAVFCILERLENIKSPGAYLRHLCKLAENGSFSVKGMLGKAPNGRIVS